MREGREVVWMSMAWLEAVLLVSGINTARNVAHVGGGKEHGII